MTGSHVSHKDKAKSK